MNPLKRFFCLCLLWLFVATSGWCLEPQEAKLDLYVFHAGAPVQGLDVAINASPTRTTNHRGVVEQTLLPGRQYLHLLMGGMPLLKLDLLVQEEEQLLVIVTLPEAGGLPKVDIESSKDNIPTDIVLANTSRGGSELPGLIEGQVVSADDGQPVAGAQVFVSGLSGQTRTNPEGYYLIDAPPGNRALSVVHADFNTQLRENVKVESGETVTADIALAPTGLELAEYFVVAPYIEGSVASIMAQQRSSDAVTEVIGAEQMSKSGDSDAADALKRVTGLTVEQGKFVLVRGLPPRYTKTMWNGSDLPSPDPNGRLVPLDLFPRNILKSIQVQKSFAPHNPGSFGGGLVELQTKGIPRESFLKASIDTSYNSESTGKRGLTYKGGKYDWLGFDDGTRQLPGEIAAIMDSDRQLGPVSITNPDGFSDEELEGLGESLPNIYDVRSRNLPPKIGLDFAIGKVFERDWGSFGFQGSWGYDYAWHNKLEQEKTFSLNKGELLDADSYEVFATDEEVSNGGMFTMSSEYGENHILSSNTFLIRKSQDSTREREGRRSENDQDVRESVLEYSETELLSQQFVGEHMFPEFHDVLLDWRAMVARTAKDSPDRRFYRYILQEPPVLDGSSLERRWAELSETRLSYGFGLAKTFAEESRIMTTMRLGYDYTDREREADVKRLQYRWRRGAIPAELATLTSLEEIYSAENINADGFIIDDLTGSNDDNRGDQSIEAFYLMAEVDFYDKYKLSFGVRDEISTINVSTFQASGGSETSVDSTISSSQKLPSLSAIYRMNTDMQLRASYGRSVARPDFREISTAQFIDPESGDTYVGNKDLQEAEFESYDLRWEWYPTAKEYFGFGVFGKKIENAIETVKIPGFNAPNSFQNADSGEVYGIEMGFRKTLAFIDIRWENIYVAGNVSLIESTVTLPEDSLFSNTSRERELQGQAPYVMNFSMGYSNKWLDGQKTDATLLFNQVGERIAEVGIDGQPDVVLQPTPQLDLVLQHQFDWKYRLKLTCKNLLNPLVEYTQGDKVQKSYKRGYSIGLKLTRSF